MGTVTLGQTGITVEKNAFGALPLQRVDMAAAVKLLRKASDGGMQFFDTARAYSDSEEKLGQAFSGIRQQLYIATKTGAQTAEAFWQDLHTSLRMLRTDYIDIYQFHNAAFCPRPGGEDGLYDAALEAQRQGKIRHISITTHRLAVAAEAVESGLYATLQFPFSYLATDRDLEIAEACRQAGMGFIAMKGMSGGLLVNSRAAAAFMNQYPHVLPIWGIQRERELDEFLSYTADPPVLTPELQAVIDHDRTELMGDFCRGCGYCMPCPAGIEINNCARMSLMLRRAPSAAWLTAEWQEKMARIDGCLHCGRCRSRCPYQLDTPALLQKNLVDYRAVLAGEVSVS